MINQKKYVQKITITVKGKKRKLVEYKNNSNGVKLRLCHKHLNSLMEKLLPSSENSFAYKKCISIKDCVKKHETSVSFAKYDIHHFFTSINKRMLLEKIQNVIESNLKINGVKKISKDDIDVIMKFFASAFYKNFLPIGFVSSPKLSDYFLYELDSSFANIKDVLYTRYADDILLSTRIEKYDFNVEERLIKEHLSNLKLELNESKILKRSLVNQQDSLRFLGLVLVKSKKGNNIKIPSKYIKNIIIDIHNFLKEPTDQKQIRLKGKVEYLKFNDQASYYKFTNFCRKRFVPSIEKLQSIIF